MKEIFEYKFPNGVKLKNRLVVAPMTTYSANDDLTLSDEEEVYYRARGKQFGMVITAATAISKDAQAFPNQISIKDDSYLDSMKRLAKAIKAGGAKAILQLHHGGRMCLPGLVENQDIVSASSVKANRDNLAIPRALLIEEIYDVIEDFAEAVKRAIIAGFDGVELHGANTYLIQQFFSPNSNVREDEFGGNVRKRMRFPLELVQRVLSIREMYANKNFIIGYRLSPEELENPGITLDDTDYLLENIANQDIDYIHLSLYKYNQTSIRDTNDKTLIIDRAKKIINNRLPIIGVGRVSSRKDIEDALLLGYDMVAVGMASLADESYVDNIKNDKSIKKVIDKNSLLPRKLYKRLHLWKNIEDLGYKIS